MLHLWKVELESFHYTINGLATILQGYLYQLYLYIFRISPLPPPFSQTVLLSADRLEHGGEGELA